jgi:hypothetical protein
MAKKTSKIENKTRPSLCLQTWLQQNLRISTNHKYRLYMYMDVFLQPDVLKPDVLQPDVLWVYQRKAFQEEYTTAEERTAFENFIAAHLSPLRGLAVL